MIDSQQLFSRNVLFWGEERQQQLAESCVLVAGVGGLGSTVAEILTRAGVGTLVILDDGIVDEPDLNRQIQYTQKDLGKAKVDIAAQNLADIHGHTTIIPLKRRLEDDPDLRDSLRQHKLHGIADCFDTFASRFVLETFLEHEMFLVHGGVQNDYGQITTMKRGHTSLFSELYAGMEDSGSPLPVCPQSVTTIASLMAHEVMNNLWQDPKLLNTLLIIELADFTFSKIQLGGQSQSA